jgi:hypothetical protein
MRPRKSAVVALMIIMSVATIPGFAASLGGFAGKKLGAGHAVVASCDTNGFTVSHTLSGSTVTGVVVSGIADPGCENGLLSVTVANASGVSIGAGGPQTITADADVLDNTVSVNLTPQPSAGTVAAVHVVVTGP